MLEWAQQKNLFTKTKMFFGSKYTGKKYENEMKHVFKDCQTGCSGNPLMQ
jgi:hypothetical protein